MIEISKSWEVHLIVKNMGFAKLDRETAKKIFKDVLAYRIYTLIVINATHTEFEYNGILLKSGQWVRSYSKLVEDLQYIDGRGFKKPNKSTISRAISRLVEAKIIEVEHPIIVANHATGNATLHATDNATLFSLLKVQSYQGFEDNEEVNHATDNATVHATDSATDSANKTRINKQEFNNKNNMSSKLDREYPFVEIVNYLNLKTGRKFMASTEGTQKLIKERIDQGFTLDDFKQVIDNMVVEWTGVTFANGRLGDNYLKPQTLFSEKFESYLNRVSNIQSQEPYTQPEKIIIAEDTGPNLD